jgi:hypothetical protein
MGGDDGGPRRLLLAADSMKLVHPHMQARKVQRADGV